MFLFYGLPSDFQFILPMRFFPLIDLVEPDPGSEFDSQDLRKLRIRL